MTTKFTDEYPKSYYIFHLFFKDWWTHESRAKVDKNNHKEWYMNVVGEVEHNLEFNNELP